MKGQKGMEKTYTVKDVLIVDDDEINNFVCSKIIDQAGFAENVQTSLGAREALDLLESKVNDANDDLPDLILLDINMPIMSGWDFLEEYKSLLARSNKNVVLMMLSSSVYEEDVSKANEYKEVSGYIAKPLRMEKLEEISDQFFSENLKE